MERKSDFRMVSVCLFLVMALGVAALLVFRAIVADQISRVKAEDQTVLSYDQALAVDRVAVERAIAVARMRGLKEQVPEKLVMKQMTLAEWANISKARLGPDSHKAGLDPDQRVWVIAMKGKEPFVWIGPGMPPPDGKSEAEVFDNVTVAISLDTKEYIGLEARRPNQPLPLGLQRWP